MKKLLLLFALFATPTQAGVSCSLPFNLQNNTTADATQVMANYNALVTCLGNAAAAGANNDITSLSALATPITPAQGGTPVYVGGTSAGSANAQTVAAVTPATFSLTTGNQVTFQAGFTNTGTTTINVASTGIKNVFRRSQLGATAMVGGEIIVGQVVTVIYDGTQFQLLGPQFLIGEGKEWFTNTAPPGWFLRDGTSLSRTTYADLFSVIGTTFGSVDGASFSLPDERGRTSVMRDAGRITAQCAGSATLGTGCGLNGGQVAFAQANLPSAATFTVTDPRTWAFKNQAVAAGASLDNAPGAAAPGGAFSGQVQVSAGTPTAASGGSDTPLNVLNPSLIVQKIIKY